jgi:hypothetical protein
LAALVLGLALGLIFVFSATAGDDSESRILDEVRYKSGYVNPAPRSPDFTSAMLWGIAIADTRVAGYQNAQIEISETRLSCRINVAGFNVDGFNKEIILNDDHGEVRGGLYRRHPWFGTDVHDPIPLAYSADRRRVILRVGQRPDVVWHFWSASPRAALPDGNLAGCTVKVRVKISPGALLQVGMDYWRNSTVGYGPGGNNHEAGASRWYFASDKWQDAEFTDIPIRP